MLPNFFVDHSALQCLWNMKAEKPEKYIDFTIDLIELPYWISFHSDKKSHTLKAFRQGELYTKDEEKALESGCFIVEKASGQSSGKAASQELLNCMPAFYFACLMLNCLIQAKKIRVALCRSQSGRSGDSFDSTQR